MSDNNEHHDDGHHVNYFGIYVALLILFLISVAGPMVGEVTGIAAITLITAFGIAIVKANLVVQNFMHLKWERSLIKWMLASSLILMFLLFAGVAPDVMKHDGAGWENVAAKEAVERGIASEGHDDEESADEAHD